MSYTPPSHSRARRDINLLSVPSRPLSRSRLLGPHTKATASRLLGIFTKENRNPKFPEQQEKQNGRRPSRRRTRHRPGTRRHSTSTRDGSLPVQGHVPLAPRRRWLPQPGAVVPVVQGRRVRAGEAGGRGAGAQQEQKQQQTQEEEQAWRRGGGRPAIAPFASLPHVPCADAFPPDAAPAADARPGG